MWAVRSIQFSSNNRDAEPRPVVPRDGSARSLQSRQARPRRRPGRPNASTSIPRSAKAARPLSERTKGPIFPHERPLGDQRVGDLNSKRSCQMVVTESGSLNRSRVLSVPDAVRRPGRRECREGLQRLRQPGVCQPVIAEPSTPLHGQEPASNELRQVFAGRGRGHPGQMGELTGGADAAVQKREEYGSARGIRHQRGDRGNIAIEVLPRHAVDPTKDRGLLSYPKLAPPHFGRRRSFGSVCPCHVSLRTYDSLSTAAIHVREFLTSRRTAGRNPLRQPPSNVARRFQLDSVTT